jgi:hypothetical protein
VYLNYNGFSYELIKEQHIVLAIQKCRQKSKLSLLISSLTHSKPKCMKKKPNVFAMLLILVICVASCNKTNDTGIGDKKK